MVYEPRKRPTINWVLALVVVLVFALVLYFVKDYLGVGSEEPSFSIGYLSAEETKQMLEEKAKDTYEIEDYFYYGETLNLLSDTYDPAKSDEIVGKSIILKDMTSKREYAFVVGNEIDNAISLGNLTQGFYEVYVVEDLIEKKVVMKEEVLNSIKTSLQNEKRYEITMLASLDYFEERKIYPEENYLYLQVQRTTLKEEEYDIAIDPAGYDYDFTWTVNKGAQGNGLIEYQESYKAATLLKEELEEKGYKVLLVRSEKEDINSYGEDGRLQRAYNGKAKYYIRLGFSESELNYSGFDMAYSAHSSDMFANQIIYHMKRNSDVKISRVYTLGDVEGYYSCMLLKGLLDGKTIYDSNLWIREAGGKATLAGMYSDNAKEGTAFFAKDNIYGMNSLDINLGYLTDKEDVNYWINHKEEYMQDLANAIDAYLNVGE